MAKRVPVLDFVKFIQQMVAEKAGYLMGSYCQNPKTGYLDLNVTKVKSSWKPTGWYYTQYSGKQREKALYWREHAKRVSDCAGLAEGVYEINTGECVNTKARFIYSQWCTNIKGKGMIPAKYRVPGACVFWSDSSAGSIHHVAYLEKPVVSGKPDGDWYIIEARGVMYGVVRTKLYSRKPNYYGWMEKYYDYSGVNGNTTTANNTVETTPVTRLLKNGKEGDDVKALQEMLIELGYDCGKWGADGDFGDATELAVKAFQKANGLEVDGIVGEKTSAALTAAIAKQNIVENPKKVTVVGGKCYIRTLPNTSGAAVGVAHENEVFDFAGEIDEETRWISIIYQGGKYWISGKYGRLIE